MTLRLKGSNSGDVSLKAPATAGDNTITLPTSNGSAEQFLKNSGTAGELEFSSMIENSTGVGIDVSSPQADFHIGNADGASRDIVMHVQNNGNARLRFREGSTITSGYNEYSIGMAGSDDSLTFEIQGQGRVAQFDGGGRLLIGTGSDGAMSTSGGANLQVRATSEAAQIILGRNDTTATSGETLGMLKWVGNDGGSYQECAAITAVVDANHGNNDKPTRLSFFVSNDNTATLTEHLRVDSAGRTSIQNVGGFYSAGEALSVSTSNNGSTQVMRNTNPSFSNTMLFGYSSRSANQAFQFIKFASAAATDSEFILRGDGNAYADGSWNGGGADYAEYFEWSDGNTEAEDRRGISVVLDGDKIREAVDGEEPIGVISGNPSVVGDSDVDRWKGKYLRDDFGTYLQDTHNVVEWDETITDDDGSERIEKHSYEDWNIPAGVVVPDDAVVSATDENGQPYKHRRLNPDYNPETAYVSREDRPEWDTVGLMGKLRIRKGQITGARWIKMRDVSDTVEEWLVR